MFLAPSLSVLMFHTLRGRAKAPAEQAPRGPIIANRQSQKLRDSYPSPSPTLPTICTLSLHFLVQAHYTSAGLAGGTLEEVLTASRSVLARLNPGDGNAPPQDVLPGITAAGRIQELADAITTYGGKDQAQGAKQTEAGKLLEAIKANVPKLAKLRRQVQLAADQAWPWRTPGVATIRKAFLLSPDRPMKD